MIPINRASVGAAAAGGADHVSDSLGAGILAGLLGMLVGEQIAPVARRLIDGQPVTQAWFAGECQPKIIGLQAKQSNTETRKG